MTAPPRLDVLIQPFCLRFSLQEDEIVYHLGGHADVQLDRMEKLLGIDPAAQPIFDCNLGFLPVATTVLIRGERTIVVDPGNHHLAAYGMLGRALARFGLRPADVDLVIATHSHHDHLASLRPFAGKDLLLGPGEIAYANEAAGEAATDALLGPMATVREIAAQDAQPEAVMPGVAVVATPGHTPGHLSVLVETADERIVVAGDTTMTRAEYEHGAFSHWYDDAQRAQLAASRERLRAWRPTLVLPGHDRAFRPEEG
jgi:glyoxylase-like metal-dependent hydrolase (beta-lactamase superfamily II)